MVVNPKTLLQRLLQNGCENLDPSSGTGGAGIVGRAACKDPVQTLVKDQGIMKSISSVVNHLEYLDYLLMMVFSL